MRKPRAWYEAQKLAAREAAGQSPQACPLCGRDMEPGSLFPGRKNVFWVSVSARRRPQESHIKLDTQGISLERFKTAWFCRSCGKMVFAVPGGDGGPAPER